MNALASKVDARHDKINEIIAKTIKDDKYATTLHFEDIINNDKGYNRFKQLLDFFPLEIYWEAKKTRNDKIHTLEKLG